MTLWKGSTHSGRTSTSACLGQSLTPMMSVGGGGRGPPQVLFPIPALPSLLYMFRHVSPYLMGLALTIAVTTCSWGNINRTRVDIAMIYICIIPPS